MQLCIPLVLKIVRNQLVRIQHYCAYNKNAHARTHTPHSHVDTRWNLHGRVPYCTLYIHITPPAPPSPSPSLCLTLCGAERSCTRRVHGSISKPTNNLPSIRLRTLSFDARLPQLHGGAALDPHVARAAATSLGVRRRVCVRAISLCRERGRVDCHAGA